MTEEQYWERDPWLFRSYKEAHKLENAQKNQEMWMQGLYFHEALSVVMHNSFKEKSAQAAFYPTEPFPLTEEERAAREERENCKVRAVAKAKFEVWAEGLKLPEEGGDANGDND